MKVTPIFISALCVMVGVIINNVITKVQETPMNCEVRTIGNDDKFRVSTGTFTTSELDAIVEHGGGMLGAHVDDLRNQDGDYVGAIDSQEEVFSGAVVCKKSVSI